MFIYIYILVLLLGSRTHTKIQHFTHFTIAAEAHTGGRRPQVASPRRVGRFQLFSDSLTKFNDRCVNTVSEADNLPKTEVQVMWVAPESGSGCVSLSAMVYEGARSWFSDDGQLTQVICEHKPTAADTQKECCACDEAKYSVSMGSRLPVGSFFILIYPFTVCLRGHLVERDTSQGLSLCHLANTFLRCNWCLPRGELLLLGRASYCH